MYPQYIKAVLCIYKWAIICLGNGWLPGRSKAIISINADLMSIGTFKTNFSVFLIEIDFLLKNAIWSWSFFSAWIC